jgi:hypothetical protein
MAGDRVTPPEEPLVITAPTHGRPVEPHGFKFRAAYALLAVVLGAAVGGFIVLLGRGGSDNGLAWSKWEPQGSAYTQTRQIASVVGSQYRLPSGKQLVSVYPRIPPAVEASQETPISQIVLAQSAAPGDIQAFPTSTSVEYVLCGVGSTSGRCAIGEGKATVQRSRLLHREALELALYTFKYVDGVDSVVTLQPPKAGSNPTYALFFRKDEFKDELDHPLRQTLQGASPYTSAGFSVAQQARVAQIVTPYLFRFSYQQAPDLSALLVLQPLAA